MAKMTIEDAKRIVNSWPEWKKNLLQNSMNPTCPTREYGKRIENKMSDETRAYCGLHEYECKENKKQLLSFINNTGGEVHRRLLALIGKEYPAELKRITKKMNNQQYIQNRPSWDHTFMTMAYELAKRSHDCQTQHGSIIVNDRKQILGSGYNGFIKGIDDSKLPNTRPKKYPWMIHSEINAILNCEHRPVGATIYVTGHPCLHCYQCIYQAGISRIIYDAREERNAVMIDEEMMDNIRLLEKLIDGKILKVPYYYDPDNGQIKAPYIILEPIKGDITESIYDERQMLNCKKCDRLIYRCLLENGICQECIALGMEELFALGRKTIQQTDNTI